MPSGDFQAQISEQLTRKNNNFNKILNMNDIKNSIDFIV